MNEQCQLWLNKNNKENENLVIEDSTINKNISVNKIDASWVPHIQAFHNSMHHCYRHSDRSVNASTRQHKTTSSDFSQVCAPVAATQSVGVQVGKPFTLEQLKPLASRMRHAQLGGQTGTVKHWLHVKPPNCKDDGQACPDAFFGINRDLAVTGSRNLDCLASTFTVKQRSFEKADTADETNEGVQAVRDKWSLNSTKSKFESLKQVYSQPQKPLTSSKVDLSKENPKHPWLINGSKYNKMKKTEKMWER